MEYIFLPISEAIDALILRLGGAIPPGVSMLIIGVFPFFAFLYFYKFTFHKSKRETIEKVLFSLMLTSVAWLIWIYIDSLLKRYDIVPCWDWCPLENLLFALVALFPGVLAVLGYIFLHWGRKK